MMQSITELGPKEFRSLTQGYVLERLVRRGQVLRSRILRPPGSLSVHPHRRTCPSAPA